MSFLDNFKEITNPNVDKTLIATTATRDQRLSICQDCEHLLKLTNTCKKCGCFMTLKTCLSAAKCPIGKW